MTPRIRSRWQVLASALAAATLVFSLQSSPGARPQAGFNEDAWLKSGDPCYPTKQNKKLIEGYGADSSYMSCVPLTVEVRWDVQEVFHHHGGLGTSRANYSLIDKYPAYLELVYKSAKSTEVSSFHIQAPAPCCPGSVETELERGDVVLITCNTSGRGCKPFASNDTLYFKLEKVTDTAMGLKWDENEGAYANFHSSRIQFNSDAVTEPYRAVNGLEVLDSVSNNIDFHGEPGFTPADIARLVKDGEVQEVFTDKQDILNVGLPVSGGHTVKATVKLIFASDWEKWRVTLQGWSKDDIRSDIKYTKSGVEQLLPVQMEFDWAMEGEFLIRNPKKNPVFDSGKVTKAALLPRLIFQGGDLFKCDVRNCDTTYDIAKLAGALLSGSVSGKTVTLSWPQYDPAQCVLCRGKRVATEKVTYREKFSTSDFMRLVSKQPLTLKDGFTVSGKPYGWMSYTLGLKKIK